MTIVLIYLLGTGDQAILDELQSHCAAAKGKVYVERGPARLNGAQRPAALVICGREGEAS